MRRVHYYVLTLRKTFPGMFCFRLLRCLLLSFTAYIILFCPLGSQAYAEEETKDICKLIPGGAIAEAIDGKILETKSLDKRCVYIVGFRETDPASRAFVIYHHDASDYEGLRDAMEGEIKHLEGIGDEAVIAFDSESGRYWLLVVKRGEATYQVSGDNEDMVRKIAVAALKKRVP